MPRCNNATPQCKFTTTRCIDTMTRCMFTTPHCNDATAQCMLTMGRCKNATPRCTITTGHCIDTSPKKSLQRLIVNIHRGVVNLHWGVVNIHCLVVSGQFPVRKESYSRVNWPFGSAQGTCTAREASLRQRLNIPPFPCILWSKTMSCGRLKMFSLLENSRGIL